MDFNDFAQNVLQAVVTKSIDDFTKFEQQLSLAFEKLEACEVRSFERAFTLALTTHYSTTELIEKFDFLKNYLTAYGVMGLSRGLRYEDFLRVRACFRELS